MLMLSAKELASTGTVDVEERESGAGRREDEH